MSQHTLEITSNKCFNKKKLSSGLKTKKKIIQSTMKKMNMVTFLSKKDMKRDIEIIAHFSSMRILNILFKKNQFSWKINKNMLIITLIQLLIINTCSSIQIIKTKILKRMFSLKLHKLIAIRAIQMKNTTTSMITTQEERITSTQFTREFLMSVLKTGDQKITWKELSILMISCNTQSKMGKNSISMIKLFYPQIKREAIFMFINHPLWQEKIKLRFITTKTTLLMLKKLKKYQLKSPTSWKTKNLRETQMTRTSYHTTATI